MWRNWQTRRSQKPVMVTSWRFKSSHPHHELKEASAENRYSPFLCFDEAHRVGSPTVREGHSAKLALPDGRASDTSRLLPLLQLSADNHANCTSKRHCERRPKRPVSFFRSLHRRNIARAHQVGIGLGFH